MRGNNGDFLYDSTGNSALEFFSKAGSLFVDKKSFYGEESSALELFKPAFSDDNVRGMKLAFWLRDCRGGAGNRSGFRAIVSWLSGRYPEWVIANLNLIPKTGRWDDLIACVDTPCESFAMKLWADAILQKDGLACKWAPREKNNKVVYSKLRKLAKMSPKDFRKHLADNTSVIETNMCSGEWYEIDYNTVPSVAMARSAKAFLKHDAARFDSWKNSLENPESTNKVNASVLFPHDVLRTLFSEIGEQRYFRGRNNFADSKLANAQFEALPNYMEGLNMRIMSICDFSGSMCTQISGSIRAIDVSLGLGLYCSDRVGKENPFYRMFIPFSDSSKLISWQKDTFSIAAQKVNDGWCGSTNIQKALDQILDSAKMFGATNEQIPNCLLILSDMQFNEGSRHASETVIESCMKKWEKEGYTRPRIVYWNLAGYKGSTDTFNRNDVALVSGFSPSLLKAILGGEDFSPMTILERAIAKYEIVEPSETLLESLLN